MSEWQETGLGAVAKIQTGPFGSQLKNEQYITGGTPVVTVEHINNFRVLDFDYPSVTEEDKSRLSKYSLRAGDIVFTRVGSVDLSAYIQPHQDGWMFSSRMLRVRPNDSLDARYLSYFFQQKSFRENLLSIAVGATMPSINTEILEGVPVKYPPPPEQKTIAGVLSSLDDKIDLLHRQNTTLEAMAETLFRQCFVEGAQEDWKTGIIADLIEFNPSRKLAKGSVSPYLEMAALSNTTFSPNGWYNRELSSGTKFMNGDTLLARITPCLENGKAAFVTFLNEGQVAWGSTEYIVMRPKAGLHPFFAYTLARDDEFRDYAEGCMEGSSGRQRVNVDHLKGYEFKLPSTLAINQFNSFAAAIVPKLHTNSLQIKTLEKLRDTLLPKLMSGEVRVMTKESEAA